MAISKRTARQRQDFQPGSHALLEPRHLLASISCGPEAVEDFSSSTEIISPAESVDAEVVAETLSFTGRRFRWPSLIQAPTTERLGELDGEVTEQGSNSFFDRIDRYEFEVSEAGNLNADLDFSRSTFSRLAIYDHSRNLISIAALRGESSTALSTDLEQGKYVAIVFGGFGQYSLSLDFVAAEDPEPTSPELDPNINPDPEDFESDQPIPQPESTPQPAPLTELPDAPQYGGRFDWNLNAVNAPEAWQAGYRGEDVVVAVIDTGVNINHSDLNDNIWVNADEIAGDGIDNDGNGFVDDRYGWNFVDNNANVFDDNGHGTHVAGSIAAEHNGVGATGVAPDAEILSIKALNEQGSGFVSAIADGIRYAVDNGADIINLSLGGGYSRAIASAISYAASRDVFVVAAAGNESASVPGSPASLSRDYGNLISVGAHDSSGRIASFSNRVGNSGAVQVDAPGVNIYSTAANGGYTWLSGTSMAAPHVAGLAALTLSANSNLTAESLRNIVVRTSNRSAAGSDANGIVNSSLALPQAINSASAVTSAQTNSVGNLSVESVTFSRAFAIATSAPILVDLSAEAETGEPAIRLESRNPVEISASSASQDLASHQDKALLLDTAFGDIDTIFA